MALPSPPAPSQEIGNFCVVLPFSFPPPVKLSDNGPNNGFQYISSASATFNGLSTGYYYAISPDLENASSTFSQAQCGNYNPQTNQGFISQAALLSGTIRHESGGTNSHYAQYASASAANNIGTILETQVGATGDTNFATTSTAAGNNAVAAITNSSETPEPCNPSYNSSCTVFNGFVNYSPYVSCN